MSDLVGLARTVNSHSSIGVDTAPFAAVVIETNGSDRCAEASLGGVAWRLEPVAGMVWITACGALLVASRPPNSLKEMRVDFEIGDDPAALDELADAVVRGCSIRYARIQSLRRLIETVQRHPGAKLAPPREERGEDWKPPPRNSPDALTILCVRGGEIVAAGCESLDVRISLEISTRFGKEAEFVRTSFSGHVGFRETNFTGTAQFEETSFSGDAEFDQASFGRFAGFERASFRRQGSFDGASFSATAGFVEARFGGHARFGQANFAEEAAFDEAHFNGDVWFHSASVGGNARFDRASFGGVFVKFTEVRFDAHARFEQASFHGLASFEGASFSADAWFAWTSFGQKAVFDGAYFGKNAGFDGVNFGDEAEFSGVNFGGDAGFDEVRFGGNTRFNGTIFRGRAEFTRTNFGADASFAGASFSRYARFTEASFGADGWFHNVNFGGTAVFAWADFRRKAVFDEASFDGDAWFHGTCFDGPAWFHATRFKDMVLGDLRRCFLRTVSFGVQAKHAQQAKQREIELWLHVFNQAPARSPDGHTRRIAQTLQWVRRLLRAAEPVIWHHLLGHWRQLAQRSRAFGWNVVRSLGQLQILNRVSLVALIAVPVVVAFWPAVRALAGAYHRHVAESHAAMDRLLLEIKRAAGEEDAPLSPEVQQRILEATERAGRTLGEWQVELLGIVSESPHIGATLALVFFAAVFVTLGQLIYQVFAPEEVRKHDEDEFIDLAHQRYPESAADRDDGLRRAIEHLETIAKRRPDRHPNLVVHHGDTIWIPPRDRIDWFGDLPPKGESGDDTPGASDASVDEGVPVGAGAADGESADSRAQQEQEIEPTRGLGSKRTASSNSGMGIVPGAERRRITIEEGARAEYWLKSRERLSAALASFGLYLIGIGCLLWILGIQAHRVGHAAGWW